MTNNHGTVRLQDEKSASMSTPHLTILKIGGNIINNDIALDDFLSDFAKIDTPKVLVHGGGKLATKLAEQMGVGVKMIEGRRITDRDTLEIVTMVYAGRINKNVIAKLQAKGCNSLGFTGADGNTIVSDLREVKTIDYGFAGDVKQVNTEILEVLIKAGVTPVFCALTHDKNGQLLNTNADTIASELAIALSSTFNVHLLYCFEKKGVLKDLDDEDSVIKELNLSKYKKLRKQGLIAEGMLPKLENCFHAIKNGVKNICIGNHEMIKDPTSICTKLKT